VGTGRALAAVAILHARGAGAPLVRLRAPAGAAAFWEACGFTPLQDARATHALVLRP
jgi:predicted N-acetyltransferase YhbS